jgi:hypothetical protein
MKKKGAGEMGLMGLMGGDHLEAHTHTHKKKKKRTKKKEKEGKGDKLVPP